MSQLHSRLGTCPRCETSILADQLLIRYTKFPSDHAPSKYARFREGLEDSYSESAIEALLSNNDIDELLREYEVPAALDE